MAVLLYQSLDVNIDKFSITRRILNFHFSRRNLSVKSVLTYFDYYSVSMLAHTIITSCMCVLLVVYCVSSYKQVLFMFGPLVLNPACGTQGTFSVFVGLISETVLYTLMTWLPSMSTSNYGGCKVSKLLPFVEEALQSNLRSKT